MTIEITQEYGTNDSCVDVVNDEFQRYIIRTTV